MPERRPRVEIRYCPKCGWLLRASWMASELLTTFANELGEVALVPDEPGTFQIHLEHELIWCRRRDEGFPDLAELKRRVRDRVAPGRSLGHIDQPRGSP